MDHANFAPVRRISQVTRLLFPYALSPVTPGSPSAAFKCRFADDGRLRPIRKISRPHLV
jgi:hypothetical protein